MEEYDDIFDEEYDEWLNDERIRQEDYFDNHADEMYEQYVTEEYERYERENRFVLIYNTSSLREYIIPGTNIHKTESLKDGKVVCTSYFKKYSRNEEN